jgi:HlyD family secretion protein
MAEAQIKTAKANLNKVLAQQEGSRALIAQRQAALHLSEIQLRYCTIQSPIDGIVISRQVDVGQTVAASLQSPILFTIAEDLSRMQVEADVSEADVGQIQPDQEVEFTVDAFPEKRFKARVRQVRNAANNVQNVVTYTIVADVENESLLLRPGMTANVTIIVAEVGDALKVPNAALRFKPPHEGQAEAAPRTVAVRDRPVFKNAVEKVGLDPSQSEQFEAFIRGAGEKLRAAYALPEDQRDIPQAWKNFYTEINQKLYGILREEQHARFKLYIEDLKAGLEKRKGSRKMKPAKVYVLNEAGRPETRNVLAGVTDETHTQILTEELKEGDRVIVGIAFDAAGERKERASIFSSIFSR